MQLQVTSDNIEISPSMKVLSEEKLEKLGKHFVDTPEDLAQVRVVLNSGVDNSFDVSVELKLGKTELYGKSNNFTLEAALIDAIADVERQYIKEKSIRESKDWEEARELKRFPIDEEEVAG